MKTFFKNNWFTMMMVLGMLAGAITGWLWPGATVLEPLGTIFINLMFCVVVPLVFFSISSAIANMVSARKAGKVMGTTVITFLCTAAIAAVIMYVIVRIIGVVPAGFEAIEPAEAEPVDVTTLIINFFTKPDFTELFSRRAILPLIVAAILFGFGVQMAGGKKTMTRLSGRHLRPRVPQGLWPHTDHLLCCGLCLHVYLRSHLCPLRRRQGRGEGHVGTPVPACHGFLWHLLLRRHHPDQHGGL